MITQVGLHDSSYFTFDYTNSLQASIVRRFTSDQVQRASTSFDYDGATSESPRLTASRVSAHNWTGINGVPAEVITQYSVAGSACVMTAPDGTVYKEFYGTGWQKGLTTASEVWSGGVRQKWTTTTWTQDDTSVNYQLNPRVTESNVYDAAGNRRRTTVDYHQSFGLPSLITEYAADAVNVLRRTSFDYKNDAVYVDRHIIGLPFRQQVYDGSWNLVAKNEYGYDWDWGGDMFQDTPAPATQHDRTNYGPSFIVGRGNLSQIARFDVNDPNNAGNTWQETKWRVNSTGSVLMERDHQWHQKFIAYGDSFSDGNNSRNTFAYPTTITDAGGFSSYLQYNFDFGANTRVQGPPPAGQAQGLIQTLTYDNAVRLERVTTTNNNAYTRFVYGVNFVQIFATVNTVNDEAYAIQVFDGLGRVTGAAGNHPGSTGGYSAQLSVYDLMGRAIKQSNPAEINSSWVPAGDDAAGWLYTQQTYDWQGRPRITTNTDGTTREASYGGCGCAGGTVVTLTDEGTIDGGVAKRRQQKIYSDVLGRTVKTEVLNWQGGSVYSATVNTYNARDQITLIRQYAGPEGSGTFQDTIMTYDGRGRLKTRHVPEQNAGTGTTWDYNSDDTVQKITDARGASQTFSYNSRHLVTAITYAAPSGITTTPNVSYDYDAAGNRTSMTDGLGSVSYSYNQLSKMTSETRTLNGLGSYPLTYEYNLVGQLKKITDHTNVAINYNYDTAGRATAITGANTLYGGISQYASGFNYRAWGSIKAMTYGNNYSLAVSYNSRLQGTQFEVSGRPAQFGSSTVMKTQYQYYADGSLKFADDLLDQRFDRAYSYDHTTLVKEAYSGGEARDYVNGTSGSGATGPYRQTYQHDVFSHLTSRANRYWSRNDSFTATYTNNRRQGFQYDADGRLQQDDDLQYHYDAAGQNIAVFDSDINKWLSYFRDGDGQLLKRVETVFNPIATGYYVRSTVLGGRVITELNQNGQKHKGYVFGGGQLLAEQENNVVTWKYSNPFTGSRGSASSDGYFYGDAELEPMGVNIGFWDPFIELLEGPAPEPFQPTLLGDESSCGSNPNCTRCSLDGMEISCERVMHLMDIGAAQPCQSNECGTRVITVTGRTADGREVGTSTVLVPPGSPGWDGSLDGTYRTNSAFSSQFNFNDPSSMRALLNAVANYPAIYGSSSMEFFERIRGGATGFGSFFASPEKTRVLTIDPVGIGNALERMLKSGGCGDFVKELINRLAADTKNPFHFDNALDLFKAVKDSPKGGLVRGGLADKHKVSATVSGYIGSNNAAIHLNSHFDFGSTDPQVRANSVIFIDAFDTLHELIHHAGRKGYYNDIQIARTLHNWLGVPGLPVRKRGETEGAFIGRNSTYFSQVLASKCPVLSSSK